MPKPYSQDLHDRVIDAVERGKKSRRTAARRYKISESMGIKWLGVERDGSREPVGQGGHRLPSWRRTVIFWKLRAPRSRTSRVIPTVMTADRCGPIFALRWM
jgi:transposase